MKAARLADRGVVRVAGDAAQDWLQALVTNDIAGADGADARFAALLSPQGKILFDFIVSRREGAFLLDCARAQASTLARRLAMYRLRASVEIADMSADLGVMAIWDSESAPAPLAARDPRHVGLGWRLVAPEDELAELAASAAPGSGPENYEALRVALGVPEGGKDFAFGEIFPHDANMDELHGVDFRKGCYVGQEVVSRVQHRGSARKRFRRVAFAGAPVPAGASITAGGVNLGAVTSFADGRGLALVRVDKVADALAAGHTPQAGETAVTVDLDA